MQIHINKSFRWLCQQIRAIVRNPFTIVSSMVRVICLYPMRTIGILYLLQVLLATAWPPLQLFGPNPLRDFLALDIFAPLETPSNHQLAGVLTYFKQHITYLAFVWYFFLLKLRLEDSGQPTVELQRQENWGSANLRLFLMSLALGIWSYRYFVKPGFEEPFWGPVGKGLFSGLYFFIQDPIANLRFICVPPYRFLETGSFLFLSLVGAATLPMFFILRRKRKWKHKQRESAEAKMGRVLFLSAPFAAIVLIAILVNTTREISVGELPVRTTYIWFVLLLLILVGIYTLYEAWRSVNSAALPSEQRLGRMFKLVIVPLIVTLLYGGLRFVPFRSFASDPRYMTKVLESRVIGDFGTIFRQNLDARETFRKRLKELVEPEFHEADFWDEHCYPMTLPSAKTLSPGEVRRIRLVCLQAQVAILYGLDQLPALLDDEWQKHVVDFGGVDITKTDLLDAYVHMPDHNRHELTENYKQLETFEKLGFLGKGTFGAIHDLNTIDWVILNSESVEVYRTIESKLKSEFDSYVGK